MKKLIVLDIGHLGHDSGAVGNGYREVDINEDIAKIVRADFERHGWKVVVSTGTLAERVAIEKREKPDMFVSIHTNSYSDPKANGFEVWVYQKGGIEEQTGQNIIDEVMASKAASRSRGVKDKTQRDLYVLRETSGPAILVEVAFISNSDDIKYVADDAGKKRMARAIVKGIFKTYGVTYIKGAQSKPEASDKPDETMYRVCIGSFNNIENARNMVEKAKENGYSAFIHTCKE